MILSVSRRTDIPCCYSEWFFERLQEGKVCVRNPFNWNQVSDIAITPDVVDCIVFWTKNPEPMIKNLGRLSSYPYYFQFTLNAYEKDIEPGLPDKGYMQDIFRTLSEAIGPKRIIWRYDPILLNARYTQEYHLEAFERIAERLEGYTRQVVVSLVDMYKRTKENAGTLKLESITTAAAEVFIGRLARVAEKHKMKMVSCTENLDLKKYGVERGSCIDKSLIEELIGCELKVGQAKGQRVGCGCVESLDIGAYNTCRNGCKYCYANYSDSLMEFNRKRYRVESPLLCDTLIETDRIKKKTVESWKNPQLRLGL